MQVVIDHAGSQREVDLEIEDPRACVADLLGAVDGDGLAARAGVVIEGRFFGPDAGLDEIGLHEGAVVSVADRPPPQPPRGAGPLLAIVAGPAAGAIHHLDAPETLIGRSPECDVQVADPSVSQRHAKLHRDAQGAVVVEDLGSHNGTWLDGQALLEPSPVPPGVLLRLGATHARVLGALPDDRPIAVDPLHRAVGGLVPFNRPPRPAPPHNVEQIRAPTPPKDSGRRAAFSIVSVLAPLVMGGLLILIFRNPRFAIFMLLSPVMAVGNWVASRRRANKEQRSASKEFRRALAELDAQLAAAVAAETRRREERLPDIAETLRRATTPSTALWQRRPGHDDFLCLRAGIGSVPWEPPLVAEHDGPGDEVVRVLDRHRVLERAPVEVALSAGGVVGLVGQRSAALALARSLVCQAAVHHGPADLGMVVLAAAEHAAAWDWAKWLPHVRDPSGATRMLAADRQTGDVLLDGLMSSLQDEAGSGLLQASRDHRRGGRTRLFVLDDVSLIEGRRAPARLLLRGAAGPAAGIVVAESEDQLPAVCSTVIQLRSDLGDADLRRPQERVRIDDFVVAGLDDVAARDCARRLARYEDPELEIVGAGMPHTVRLLPLLGMDPPEPEEILAAWGDANPDPAPSTPIGLGEGGTVTLDLVRDGPHALIGGTTGSGKSELLRSLVAGMAARVDPEHLVFVLVDYKGGSAFDHCALLPHTVGMVTDLDEHLGERALKSLEAELAHRERLLRRAGAADLPAYLHAGAPLGPLPRLVVAIDEFATLASELPDFLGALVGIAQRGRSLGVHLILATQRPQGSVNANIKANTNLRIALRVQDPGDSNDIIDRKDAAAISRSNPGRAYIRSGPGEVVMVQTALSTAAASQRRASGVRLAPFRFAPVAAPPLGADADERADSPGGGPTDLERLVAAVNGAFASSGMPPPRRPWLEMLPEQLALDDVLRRAPDQDHQTVPFAVADDPDRQAQEPVGWRPRDGHLALFGMVGSGTTTAALACARALAERHPPDAYHLYAVDFGAGGLAPLEAFPHTGAVIPAADRERQFRLLRHLRRELDRRRGLPPAALAAQPRIVTVVDGIGAFLAEHDGVEGTDTMDAFKRVFADGPGVGLLFVMTGDRPGVLPLRLGSLVGQKLLLRLADPGEFTSIGVRAKNLPTFVPGRGLHADSRLVVQVGHPGDLATAAGALAERYAACAEPAAIGRLPALLRHADLPRGTTLRRRPAELVLGLADDDLGPAVLPLHRAEHLIVTGPPRSGKSSLLALLAAVVKDADRDAVVVGVCDQRSPLHPVDVLDAAGPLDFLAKVLRVAVSDERLWFVLVDDAPHVDDVSGVLAAAIRCKRPDLHIVAAGRSDELRGGYGHWVRLLRQSRSGVLLQPNLSMDGEVLSVRLPRRLPIPLVPGRGFIVTTGEPSLAQFALPPPSPT